LAKSRPGFEKLRNITAESRPSINWTLCTQKVTNLPYVGN